MDKIPLSEHELMTICPGEAITLTAVLTLLVIAIVVVTVYKLFMSGKGTIKLPGGYTFQWN
ncbi:MAG TPA: hypothetical protein VJY64_00475 [Candidatus Onthovivens sp.]|nr:hypothetical protein [Candidatus Onthovivens sp.]